MKKIKELEPTINCPRWNYCSAPICPLDPKKDERVYLPGEPKCALPRKKRMELGKKLPWKGLFPRELGGMKTWAKMKPESKEKFITRRKKYQFTSAGEK